MKISDYMPNFYKNNIEMNNIIYSEEDELENNLKSSIDNSFNDTFPIRLTINGIRKYEKILNIVSDESSESLEFRKERILGRLISKIPFTERYLSNYLDNLLGASNWSYTIDYNNYTLDIQSLIPGKLWYAELINFLSNVIPANIVWTVTIYSATWNAVNNHFNNWNEINNSNMTWQELMDGEWSVG